MTDHKPLLVLGAMVVAGCLATATASNAMPAPGAARIAGDAPRLHAERVYCRYGRCYRRYVYRRYRYYGYGYRPYYYAPGLSLRLF